MKRFFGNVGVRAFFFAMVLLIFAAIVFIPLRNPSPVMAQNAGNTGTFTGAQVAFTTVVAGTQNSPIFLNIGQSAHYLSYCAVAGGGGGSTSLSLQQSFDGVTSWIPIAQTQITNPVAGSKCGVLQAGGYYQNVRATVTTNGNTVSAWYSSTSGPIAFAPAGINQTGASSPVVCDLSQEQAIPNATTVVAINNSGTRLIAVCGFQLSFNGAIPAGLISFQDGDATCTAPSLASVWSISTTALTPQIVQFGNGQGSAFRTVLQGHPLCVTNSGAITGTLSISYTYLWQ